MTRRKDKRYRVSGYNEGGDICAFETDSRERAKAMEAQFKEDLQDVALDKVTKL